MFPELATSTTHEQARGRATRRKQLTTVSSASLVTRGALSSERGDQSRAHRENTRLWFDTTLRDTRTRLMAHAPDYRSHTPVFSQYPIVDRLTTLDTHREYIHRTRHSARTPQLSISQAVTHPHTTLDSAVRAWRRLLYKVHTTALLIAPLTARYTKRHTQSHHVSV